MSHARWRFGLLIECLLVIGLAGCGKHAAQPPPTPPTSEAKPAGPPPGSTLAIAGQFVTGDDPAAIRAYLQSV
mgnify:CR=1 FL=1